MIVITTKNLKILGSWQDVLNDCRMSVNKPPLEKEPSDEFKKEILMAEHTPIRNLCVDWQWPDIPSWCATHFARHSWYKIISTQRPDKTGKKRGDADAPVAFKGRQNMQHSIDTARKRLCFTSSDLTRKYEEDYKWTLTQADPFMGNALVPNCIYRGGCPEPTPCGFYDRFIKTYGQISNLQERYDAYNRAFAFCMKGRSQD